MLAADIYLGPRGGTYGRGNLVLEMPNSSPNQASNRGRDFEIGEPRGE